MLVAFLVQRILDHGSSDLGCDFIRFFRVFRRGCW
jgi:hypothetical protein